MATVTITRPAGVNEPGLPAVPSYLDKVMNPAARPAPQEDPDTGQGSLYSLDEIGAHLASLPRYWGTVINGDCMAPEYGHGQTVVVDKEAWPEEGDVAVIFLEGEMHGRRVVQPWIKRITMGMWKMKLPHQPHPDDDLIPLFSLQSNLPNSDRTFRACQVHGFFKVLGRYEDFHLIGETLVRRPTKKRRGRPIGNGKAGHEPAGTVPS